MIKVSDILKDYKIEKKYLLTLLKKHTWKDYSDNLRAIWESTFKKIEINLKKDSKKAVKPKKDVSLKKESKLKKAVKKTSTQKEEIVKLSKSKAMNVTSVVLGGLSIVFGFLFPYVVGVTGILGLIFAYVYKDKRYKKLNRWAFVLNLIGIFLAILILTLSIVAFYLLLKSGKSLGSIGALA